MGRSDHSVLTRVPFFADFPPKHLDAIAKLLRSRRYPKGSIIFHEGDPGTSLFVIESGEVKLTRTSAEGTDAILALLGPGAVFGELALLDGKPRSAAAAARTPCSLLALDREPFLRFLDSAPGAAVKMLVALSHRLRRTTELVHEAAFLDVPARLASTLLQLTEGRGRPRSDGVVGSPRLTQEELGEMAGATRVSINKWLGAFEREGLVRRQKGYVVVLQPEGLRQLLG